MRMIRKKALLHDAIVSMVIGILITMLVGVDGIFWTALAVIEFSFGAFIWVVAYDPALERKKKGGFINNADEVD